MGGKRFFVPIRGDVSLTWGDIALDDASIAPPETAAAAKDYAPFKLDCGPRSDGRCDASHHAGSDPNEPGNTRDITRPGEPFGMAQSEDGTAIAITHQTDTRTSLFASNLVNNRPALQFVADSLPAGGIAIAAVPHDPDAFRECVTGTPADCARVLPRPAFMQVSRAVAQLSVLRYYDDIGQSGASTLYRPHKDVNDFLIAKGKTKNQSDNQSNDLSNDQSNIQFNNQFPICHAPGPTIVLHYINFIICFAEPTFFN